jgi:hypothetical protein
MSGENYSIRNANQVKKPQEDARLLGTPREGVRDEVLLLRIYANDEPQDLAVRAGDPQTL